MVGPLQWLMMLLTKYQVHIMMFHMLDGRKEASEIHGHKVNIAEIYLITVPSTRVDLPPRVREISNPKNRKFMSLESNFRENLSNLGLETSILDDTQAKTKFDLIKNEFVYGNPRAL